MHDPMCVAFEIRRPWPRRDKPMDSKLGKPRWKFRGSWWKIAGRAYYWPGFITVWHVEPDGHDSGTVCCYRDQWRHVHHWKIQVSPLQELRRRLLTRCAWCGGRSRKRDAVNVSHQWDGERGPWWRGERGLFHGDCSTVSTAHSTCTCESPILEHNDWGSCLICSKSRSWGAKPEHLARMKHLAATVPVGRRESQP